MRLSRIIRYYLITFLVLYIIIGLASPLGFIAVNTLIASGTLAVVICMWSLIFFWFWDSDKWFLQVPALLLTGIFGGAFLLGARWVWRRVVEYY